MVGSASDALKVIISANEWVKGGINDSGEEASNSYTIRSGSHRITPNTYIQFDGAFRGPTDVVRLIQGYFYKADGSYIDKYSVNASDSIFVIPEESAYVRFKYGHISSTGIKVDDIGLVNLATDFSVLSYSANESRSIRLAEDIATNTQNISENTVDIAENTANISGLEESAQDALKVVVNVSEWVKGGINDYGEEAMNSYVIRSDYHRITPETYIEFNGAFRGQTDVIRSIQAFYFRADKTYISKYSVNESNPVFVIPDASAYVRFRYGHITSTGIQVDDIGLETLAADFSVLSYSATKARTIQLADSVDTNTEKIADLVQLAPNSGAIFTFIDDDGYAEQVAHWAEISKETGIKISESVVTGWVGQQSQAPSAPYLRPLTWNEIVKYQGIGFEFVSHSHNHAKFGGTGAGSQSDLIADVEASQQALSAHNCSPDFLVYPGGHHDNNDNGIVDNVVRTHFKGAVAISNVPNTVPLYTYSIFRYSVVDESGGKVEVTDSNGDTRQVYPMRDLQWFKDLVDDAIAGKKWIVFMSHLYNYGNYYYNADVKSRISDVAKYIVQNGGRIMTLSEAFEQRKNLFESAPRHKNVSYIVGYDGGIYDKH